MQTPDGARLVAAACAGEMQHLDGWQIVDGMSRFARSAAEVCVFKVHKKALIHSSDLLQRAPPNDHARTGYPVYF